MPKPLISAIKPENTLTRDASGDDRLAQFLWALMIVAVESGMNSFFFREVQPLVLLADFLSLLLLALSISVLRFWAAYWAFAMP